MRKATWLAVVAAGLIAACSKNDERPDTRQEVKFYAYKIDEEGAAKKTSAYFYFFDASKGQQFTEERIDIPSGTETEYKKVNSRMMRLLLEYNQFELTDGSLVEPLVMDHNNYVEDDKYILVLPDYRSPNRWDPYRSHNSVRVPEGRYFVVVVFGDYHDNWVYKHKYMGRYLTISAATAADTMARVLTVDFPYDSKHKGYTDWQGVIREPADSLQFKPRY